MKEQYRGRRLPHRRAKRFARMHQGGAERSFGDTHFRAHAVLRVEQQRIEQLTHLAAEQRREVRMHVRRAQDLRAAIERHRSNPARELPRGGQRRRARLAHTGRGNELRIGGGDDLTQAAEAGQQRAAQSMRVAGRAMPGAQQQREKLGVAERGRPVAKQALARPVALRHTRSNGRTVHARRYRTGTAALAMPCLR